MDIQPLAIDGAWVMTPRILSDDRGSFLEWFRQDRFAQAAGHAMPLEQANCSVSAAGVVRGIHFADVPPGQAKYVTCVSGRILDVVVDIRVGSPTFGRWTSVILDPVQRRAVYIADGLGHGFASLAPDSTVLYLCSTGYDPQREHELDPLDPALGIDWQVGRPHLSDKDASAPTLDEARMAGLLPDFAACLDLRPTTDGRRE